MAALSISNRWFRILVLTLLSFLIFEASGFPAVGPAEIVSLRPGAFVTVEEKRREAVVGQEVSQGNLLETDSFGRLSLLLPDHALLKIGGDTRFRYEGVSEEKRSWFLDRGKVWLRGLFRRRPFRVETPTAVIGVRGTEWYMVVQPDGAKVGVGRWIRAAVTLYF